MTSQYAPVHANTLLNNTSTEQQILNLYGGLFDEQTKLLNKQINSKEQVVVSDSNPDVSAHHVLSSLYKDDDTVTNTILTNICCMFVRRGYFSSEKYMTPDNTVITSKMASLYKYYPDTDVYKIHLDSPIKISTKTNDTHKEYDGSTVVVKLIYNTVSDINNNTIFNDFVESNEKYHKLIVFFDATDRVFLSLDRRSDIEAFSKNNLMIDLMAHVAAPYDCAVISHNTINYVINKKIAKILKNDPLAKYYNAKRGDILKIVRRSINNGKEIGYRQVITSHSTFK